MQRSPAPTSALYVRLPEAEAGKLDRAARALGVAKKELVTDLVATLVDPDTRKGRAALGQLTARRTAAQGDDAMPLGSYEFHAYDLPEVITPEQAALLLQLPEETVVQLAEQGELPGRKLGSAWRFSRSALVSWLSQPAE